MKRLCKYYSCNNIAASNGYCQHHQSEGEKIIKEREAKRFSGQRTESKRWNYLYHTKQWRDIRKRVLEQYGNRCSKCGCTTNLIVHHSIDWKTEYEFFNNEFEVWCKPCHSKHHQSKGRPPEIVGR